MSAPSRGHLVYHGRTVLLKYHRLLSGAHPHPPNSVAALRRVLADGAEVVEFDIGLTRDARFVLIHDPALERETSGRGALHGVTEAEFRALRLRDSDEPTATLAEVAGKDWTPKLEAAWTEAYGAIAGLMKQGAAAA